MEQEVLVTVWDHIADLRTTLIRVFIILGIGFLVSLCFYQPLFHQLTMNWQPGNGLTKQAIQRERLSNHQPYPVQFTVPRGAQLSPDSSFEKVSQQTYILPPFTSLDYEIATEPQLLLFGPLEGITIAFKVCFWLSVALTAPLWGWALLQFIVPGLRAEERGMIVPFLLGSVLCLFAGSLCAYFITLPIANAYLNTFNASLGQNAWSLSNYVDYTLILFLGHSIAFELGLIVLSLVHLQWISSEWLIEKRRYMIVCAFVLGALLTPPDVFTQIMLALPLIFFYELAILYGKINRTS